MVYHFPFVDPAWYFSQSHVIFLAIWFHFSTRVCWFASAINVRGFARLQSQSSFLSIDMSYRYNYLKFDLISKIFLKKSYFHLTFNFPFHLHISEG